jgi:hypothetical protein
MTDSNSKNVETKKGWVRIPDGTKVKHRSDGREGFIDGLTELFTGSRRNPDGRTQYRINVGDSDRALAVEEDLLILTDKDGLVLMLKQKTQYRCFVSERLHGVFAADRFVAST